jgi:DHA1 family tetracycline resistance protein-like MFS transporter
LSEKKNKSQLVFIFLTVFIYLLGFGIIIPITPFLSRELGATATEAGLLMSSYSLMQFLFSPFWGRLSDRIGRRPVLLFCIVCEGLTYILFAYARSMHMLFAARILAGFFGASISTASAYISDITPPNERSKGMALIGVAFGLGFVFGPALGGGLSVWGHHISSRPFFDTTFTALWVAGICFANWLFGMKYLKESLTITPPPRPRVSRLKMIAERLKMKTVGPLVIVYFMVSLSMSSMESTLVWFMGEKFNWGVKDVSFGFAYIGVMLVLTQGFIVRRMLPRVGERYTMITGLVLFIAGMSGIALAPNIPLMAVTMTFLAVGNGLLNPSTLGSISLVSRQDEQGVIMGITQSLSSLGRILGPVLGGYVYAHLAITAPFLASGTVGLFALAILFMIYSQIPTSGKKAVA